MNREIIFTLNVDNKTAFAVAFFGTIGIAAAKATIKAVSNISKPMVKKYEEQYKKFED